MNSPRSEPAVPLRWAVTAWLTLAVAVVHPAHGLGIELCPLKHWAGVPCALCGLTRSVSCAVRGDLRESVGYHPFGVAVIGAAVAVLGLCLMPASVAGPVSRWLLLRRAVIGGTVLAIVIGFGAARLLLPGAATAL